MKITMDEIAVAYRKIRALRKEKAVLKDNLKEVEKEIDGLYSAIEDNVLDADDGQMRMGDATR